MKGGFKSKRIFCMALTRRTKKPCYAKGYLTNSFTKEGHPKYLCRFHGASATNYFGFKDRAGRGGLNKPKFTDESRIKLLYNLKQFKDKPIEHVRQYYFEKLKPRIIINREPSIYHNRAAHRRNYTYRDFYKAKTLTHQLDEILCLIKKKPRTRKGSNGSS